MTLLFSYLFNLKDQQVKQVYKEVEVDLEGMAWLVRLVSLDLLDQQEPLEA